MEQTTLVQSALRELKSRLRGDDVITPADNRYDAARKVWNGLIDRRPALIVRCSSAADVLTAVRVARAHDLLVAIRGGGHNVGGTAVCEGGLVIALLGMNAIRVDPAARTVRADAGVRWRELDRTTQTFGLATPGGTDSEVGIAGLTLGGGNGWLMGLYGATCDNVISVDLVMADGRFVTASDKENEDLFWAVRGGGGNFGVVTSFTYRLHSVGPVVLGGMVTYPFAQSTQVLQHYRECTRTAPDELTVYACLITSEDGEPVVALAACYAGPLERSEDVVRPLRTCGTPLADQLRPMRYTELQSLIDEARPAGRRCTMRSHFMSELSDAAIATLIEEFGRAPSPWSAVIVEHCHGAITRVPPDATAFGLRTAPYHFEILAFWDDQAQSAANVRWAEDFFAATQPFSSGEVYVNSLDQGEAHRIRDAYGANYQRLVALKNKYDATNFFRCNQNIVPSI